MAVPAASHATLLSSDPADGAVLPTAPSELTLKFDEPVRLQDGSVRVLDAAGVELDSSAHTVDADVVVSVPPDLADGTYVVSWRVISADTHPVAGGFTFSIGTPSESVIVAPSADTDFAVRLAAAAANALGFVGALVAAGLVAFRILFVPTDLRGRLIRQIHTVSRAGALLAVAALVVLLPITTARQAGTNLSALADPAAWTGQFAADPGLMAMLVSAGLGIAVFVTRRPDLRRQDRALALGGITVAVTALALVGHTRSFGPAGLVLASHILHVTTAAVWFGGLIGLGIVLSGAGQYRPAGPGAATAPVAAQSRPDQAAAIVAGFSSAAAGLVAGLALAGVVLGWRFVGSWSVLFGTAYGLTLLAKVGVTAIVLALAGYNRYRLLPRLRYSGDWGELRSTVRAEGVLIVVALVLTGWLGNQDPRDTSDAEPGELATPTSVTVEEDLGDGALRIRVAPGAVGVNSIELTLTDAGGAPVEPLEEPRIQLSLPEVGLGPIEQGVIETGPGAYDATSDFPLEGEWIVEVSVRLSQFEEPVIEIRLELR